MTPIFVLILTFATFACVFIAAINSAKLKVPSKLQASNGKLNANLKSGNAKLKGGYGYDYGYGYDSYGYDSYGYDSYCDPYYDSYCDSYSYESYCDPYDYYCDSYEYYYKRR